ncbi:MAG TPA: cell division protein ZapB [Bryobacteraceae bacterium]|nr:cell division protein ZapB [Bryobacteraceae bacterium]
MSVESLASVDSLASLEERITRAVELVTALKAQNVSLEKQVQAAVAERDASRQELEDLRSERKQVRTRIEKLLGQMDLLSNA